MFSDIKILGVVDVNGSNPIIEFKDVSFQYQSDAAFTLNRVSFSIPAGQWTSIVGHNGSGKSTIAKLMVGIEEPSEGQILFQNLPVDSQNKREVRKHIGIVFQNPDNQFVGSIVKFDVAFGLENKGVPYEEMASRVQEALEFVGMSEFKDREPARLSGGQKQRVAIARALANDPKILISDESTSALDPKTTKQILALLQDLNQKLGLTVVLITHEMQIVKDIANRVAVMQDGHLIEEGSVL